MINDIESICIKYKTDIDTSDLSKSVSIMENNILNSLYNNEIKRYDISRVYKWNREMLISQLNKSSMMLNRMNEIKNNLNTDITPYYIIYNSFIPITSLIDKNNCIRLLNDDIKKKLIDAGYGISCFKMEKTYTIKDVWCQGKHPNVNPSDSTFCTDSDFYNTCLDHYNISLLINMMRFVNVNSYYSSKAHRDFFTITRGL